MAVDVPLRRLFDYRCPSGVDAARLQPGQRLWVPFGRQRVAAVLVELASSSTVPEAKLRAATALIGPKAAMACTAAIETEIDRHYTQQLDELGDKDPELAGMIREFRDDERAHHDAAIAAGAEQAPAYPLLSGAIRLGCRLAIRLSERI